MLRKVIKRQNNSKDCIICGMENPNGVKAAFYSMEDGTCVALATFLPSHQSYPGRTHGGMVTALLDEVIGRAYWVEDSSKWGVTMKINVEFHAAAPYGEQLICAGKLTKKSKMFFDGVAELYDKSGKLLDRAYATYMIIPLSKAAKVGGDNFHEEDFAIVIDDGVKEIDVPEIKALRNANS